MMTHVQKSIAQRSKIEADRLAHRQLKLQRRTSRIADRLKRDQNARLTIGGLFFVGLIGLAARPDLRLEVPLVLAFVLPFGFLVVRTRRIARHLNRLKGLLLFYDRQEKRARGLPSGRAWEPAQKASENLPMVRDVGLMGSHSLWTLLDETLTDGGQQRLLEWLAQSPEPAAEIKKRQMHVQSLRREGWFLTKLTLSADAEDFRLSSTQILRFIKKPFVEKGFFPLLLVNITVWIAAITFTILGYSRGWDQPALPLLGFVFLSYLSLMRAGSPFLKGVGLSHHLGSLAPIFEALEKRADQSLKLNELCPVIRASGPSREARKLNRVLAFMSVQGNPLVNMIINAISPWSLTATHYLERRRKKIAYTFPQCLEELAELEALASLVIFDRHQTRSYPVILDSTRRPAITAEGLFHPLIDRSRVVANDFSFPPGKSLGLLTGSNMSGKSTFLRTLGINQTLANIGAPVFAESLQTAPLKIETCIEVSDSLRDGFSYFYAEVRRLKGLLTAAREGTSTLFLIDEIFRGTNNRERQIGSRGVIKALAVLPNALGFISTHDLELTALESSHETLLNLHFREEFSAAGQMVFSYLLRHGPCPTTNALKIMAAEGIEVDEV